MVIDIGTVKTGDGLPPVILPEAGINHNGDVRLAMTLARLAKQAGAAIIKYQCHIAGSEMIRTDMKPGSISEESLWDIVDSSSLDKEEEAQVVNFCASIGIQYLSTPFSREAAIRLNDLGVPAFKIGSGETTNLPLLEHIAGYGKPIILSTGMTTLEELDTTVGLIKSFSVPLMLMHCVSIYPTPYVKLNLGAIKVLRERYGVPVGLSDHTLGTYTAFAGIAMGACLIEKHFTIHRMMPGVDQAMSINPDELRDLIIGAGAVYDAMGFAKGTIWDDEVPVKEFARESVVAIKNIGKGEVLNLENIWVKRPGTGEIPASQFKRLLGRRAMRAIACDEQLKMSDFD